MFGPEGAGRNGSPERLPLGSYCGTMSTIVVRSVRAQGSPCKSSFDGDLAGVVESVYILLTCLDRMTSGSRHVASIQDAVIPAHDLLS